MQAGVMVVAAVVLLCSAAPQDTAAQENYKYLELDDPLQPMWDQLDDLPSQVSDAIQSSLRSQFASLNSKVDTKMTAMVTQLTDVTSSLSGVLNNDMAEAVTKLETHVDTQVHALENRLKEYIHDKFQQAPAPAAGGSAGSIGSNIGASLSAKLDENTARLENIIAHVLKINEKVGGGEGGDTCSTLVDKVSELMGSSAGGGGGQACSYPGPQPGTHESGSYLPRDCSDKHWQEPETPSGVYETYPTLDPKAPVYSYCDMGEGGAKETGGWTVILRRRNSTSGLVNFNRTWSEYRDGFGTPGESEWWFGLSAMHALTYRQPYEVDLLLHDIEKGSYYATYSSFRVEDESHDFKLNLNGFEGNLTHDALTSKHHGSAFSTYDRDNDVWAGGSCAQRNGGGWWFNACHYTTLTAPFPTSNDRSASTIRWLEDDWLVLDDVTAKIRPVNYAERFNAHSAA